MISLTNFANDCLRSQNEINYTMGKGATVRFVAGKYAGKSGWVDDNRENGEDTVPVIVNLGRKGEKKTYVYTSSIKLGHTNRPTCYAEAVIQQCPDVERKLVDTCRAFAKCDIGRDPSGVQNIIAKEMNNAVAWQEGKGSKAIWRRVQFEG